MDGETYGEGHMQSDEEFYRKMREGSLPTTSQINPQSAKEQFLKVLNTGKDVLCISFSSGLSGTYNSCALAAEELREEGWHIEVIDSLCASLGQGLLLYKAVERKEKGASFAEVIYRSEDKPALTQIQKSSSFQFKKTTSFLIPFTVLRFDIKCLF